jgi:glycosyltransferase involved in cell wall biosynthesis
MLVKKITIKKYGNKPVSNERRDRIVSQLQRRYREKNPVNICLCMIVKNESKNMKRLLDSLKSIIDFVSIVDTGSTDDTEDVIKSWCSENNIPLSLHHEPFKNFGYNRTHSFLMAKKSFPTATYILLSDADFVWEIDSDFNKNSLLKPCYYVIQYNEGVKYWNIRLLDTRYDWNCKGVTHEFWECKDIQYNLEKISTLRIKDLSDGGCKSNKFERDEKLLRDAIELNEEPKLLARYIFYLAQTLRDMKKFEDAIYWYKERIKKQGWFEEVYYSYYQIGRCYEILMENEKAKKYYLKAYEYNNKRSEPLFYLFKMCLKEKNYTDAKKYLEMGKKIKPPEDQILFLESQCYEFFGYIV